MSASRSPAFAWSSICSAAVCFSLLQLISNGRAQPLTSGSTVEAFFNAMNDDDTNTFSQMLAANTDLIQANYYGRVPFTVAASLGRSEMVAQLLRAGADINVQNDTLDTSGMRLTALEAAIEYNHPDTCRLLLEAGADPNVQSTSDGGALHYALAYHQSEMAGWLLDYGADPWLPKKNAYIQITPLEMAITMGDGRLVPRMLGLDPDNPLGAKSTQKLPLQHRHSTAKPVVVEMLAKQGGAWLAAAAQRGELEAVQALLQAGVSASGTTPAGRPLLEDFAVAEAAASRTGHFEAGRWLQIRDLLIQKGADYDVFAATAAGDLEPARHLVAADSRLVQARDHDGQTPLHWAVQNNQPALISFWLQAGIPLGATNRAGQTALHLAAADGWAGAVKLLLAAQAPASVRDTNGWTPLEAAIHAGQTETIHLLLAGPATASHPERGLVKSIHEAAAGGDLAALAALTESTNNLEARNELGLTPLQVAVLHGHLAAAALLVDKGANVQVADPDGNTLLLLVLLQKQPQFVYDRPPINWLERMGSDPRKAAFEKYLTVGQYEQGPNPLLQDASFLLACGVDARAVNHAGQTPMQLVSGDNMPGRYFFFEGDRAALLKLLSSGGGNLNATDADGNTALHLVGQDTSADRAAGLIASGADINATNHQGRTPLHMLAAKIWGWDMNEGGTNEPFQLLVKSGANVNARDNEGLTPLHVLAQTDTSFKKEAVQLLLGAGANPNLRDNLGRPPVDLFLSGKWPWNEAGECAGLLVKAGADLSARDNQGRTPLHYLASMGGPNAHPLFFQKDLFTLFAAAKLDFNARDQDGNTPLLLAAKAQNHDVFNWLVKQGAGQDATNNAGETPRLVEARHPDPFAH